MSLSLRIAVMIAALGITYRLLRVYIAGGVCLSHESLNGKTVIITGANSGIGKSTAIDLARRGARVIMACRDMERGQSALEDIVQNSSSSNIILKYLDLASMKSIRTFAEDINMNEAELHVLINNAGVISTSERPEAEDGVELTMAVNHFGPFLLTNLLLDLLKKSSPSRVVIVSSKSHYSFFGTRSPLRIDNIQSKSFYNNFEAYGQSKLANILFTRELARRLSGSGVTVNSLHPGIVATEIIRNLGFPATIQDLVFRLLFLMFKSPEEGAQTTIQLAVAKEVESISGKFFVDCVEEEPAETAQDDVVANKLWQISAELVGLEKTR